jgi:hypothetical protein
VYRRFRLRFRRAADEVAADMSAQWYQTVGQWQAIDSEAERIEEANAALQEISAQKDDELRAELEAKFPMLRAWPQKEKR